MFLNECSVLTSIVIVCLISSIIPSFTIWDKKKLLKGFVSFKLICFNWSFGYYILERWFKSYPGGSLRTTICKNKKNIILKNTFPLFLFVNAYSQFPEDYKKI
jgi:hypothetical protein